MFQTFLYNLVFYGKQNLLDQMFAFTNLPFAKMQKGTFPTQLYRRQVAKRYDLGAHSCFIPDIPLFFLAYQLLLTPFCTWQVAIIPIEVIFLSSC